MTLSLQEIARQLESPSVKDRKLALAALRDVAAIDAVPLVKKVLDDDDQQVRSLAVYTLGVKPTAECLGLLVDRLVNEPDYGVRADTAGALGMLGDQGAFEPLVTAYETNRDWLVRFSVAVALGNLGDMRAEPTLLKALACPESVMQQAAIAALGEIGAVGQVDRILGFVGSEDWLVRQRVAEALGHLLRVDGGLEKGRSALLYLCRDEHENVAEAARLALGN
jgi:HEAT repeat protein